MLRRPPAQAHLCAKQHLLPPDHSEPRATKASAPGLRAILSRMWHHRTFRDATIVGTLNAYAYHIGLAIVFFGFTPHIAFIRRLTGLSWPAVPGWLFVIALALVFIGLVYALMIRLSSPVLLTSCANCRETFDDGLAHFQWDKPMGEPARARCRAARQQRGFAGRRDGLTARPLY